MKLTAHEYIRLTSEMQGELNEMAEQLGFRRTDLIRYLLNRAIEQLKVDSIEAGGYHKLEFTLKKINPVKAGVIS